MLSSKFIIQTINFFSDCFLAKRKSSLGGYFFELKNLKKYIFELLEEIKPV